MSGTNSNGAWANHQRYTAASELLTSPYDLTTTWTTVGYIKSVSFESIILFVTIDINSSSGVSFRVLGEPVAGGTLYTYPTLEPKATGTNIYPEVYNLAKNEDQNIMWEMKLAPAGYTKLQAKVAVVGGLAGQITTLKYSVKA